MSNRYFDLFVNSLYWIGFLEIKGVFMLVAVGIVVREYDNDTLPFGEQTTFFEDMIKECQDIPVEVVVFSPNGWQKGEFEVNGFSFRDGIWLKLSS